MKRTKKQIFDDHVAETLKKALSNEGKTVDVGKVYRRRNMVKKVLTSVTSSLDLMGIKYKNPKGSSLLVVPTAEQIQAEEKRAREMTGLQAAFMSGIDFTTKKDKGVIAQYQGNTIKFIAYDDVINNQIKIKPL